MLTVARSDTSIFGRWWWTVDRWTLGAVLTLMAIGIVLIAAAGAPVAERINATPTIFILKHIMWVPIGIAVMFAASMLTPRQVVLLASLGLAGSAVLLVGTIFAGTEIKGAKRWISIAGFSLQASELAKPSLTVFTAWMLAKARAEDRLLRQFLALGAVVFIAGLVIKQPDFGMTAVIATVAFAQFFLAGLPFALIALCIFGGVAGAFGAYTFLPHVHDRVERFLEEGTSNYQVEKAMQAFAQGGLFGRGPGEGRVKELIPDAHADFIFAVAGEEFGFLICFAIVLIFAFVVLRGFARLLSEESLFVLLGTVGLLTIFGLQAFVNMASTLALIPTKGMTLPFISYGGSSTVALSYGMGMLLALTRRRIDGEELP
jgi:cell division protein FtsW